MNTVLGEGVNYYNMDVVNLSTNEVQNSIEEAKKWPQYLAVILATLGSVCCGTVMGWTSPAIPILQNRTEEYDGNLTEFNASIFADAGASSNDTEPTLLFSDEDVSWIGSLAPLGAVAGALPAGHLANAFGRRWVLLWLNVPYLLGWALITTMDKSISSLYFARFLLGLSMGIGSVVTPLYNEEIAQVEIRGTLGSSYDLLMAIGIVLVYILGTLVPYNWLNVTCAGLCCVSFATFYFMPESPVHLLSKNKVKSAQRSLRWLRGAKYLSNYDIVPEMKQMQRLVDSSEKVTFPSSMDGVRRRLNGFSWDSPTTKSFLIASFLMFLRQFCAFNAAIYYTVEIFKEAGSMMSPFLSTIVVGSIQIPATLFATFLVDRYGRRVLLLASSTSMASCLLALSLYFYLKDFLDVTSYFSWVPLVSLSLYVAGFSLGLGPIPWFMVAELVPIESKGWVIGVVVAINWLCTFIVTKVFTSMISGISAQMTYGFFCVVCTLGTFLIVYVVPETNGKTLDEIQTELAEKSFCPPMFCVKNGDTAR